MDVARVRPGDRAGYVDVDVAETGAKAGVRPMNEARVGLLLDWIPVVMPTLSPTIPPETWTMDRYLRYTLRKLRCLVPGEESLREIQWVHWELQVIGATLQRGIEQVIPKQTL